MTDELKHSLVEIEYALCSEYPPYFLEVCYEEEHPAFIHIVICRDYTEYSINERVSEEFLLLKERLPDIINKHSVVIEAFNPDEMENLIDSLFQ
jgi:hypothetical protein